MTDVATPSITCPRYVRPARGRRCLNYRNGGRCARSGSEQTTCVEWLKVNGGPPAETSRTTPEVAPSEPLDRDLFGNPVHADRSSRGSQAKPAAKASAPVAQPAAPRKPPLVRNVTDEEVASFKALGAEVCIRSAGVGEVWLVPEYTGADRMELSVEHSITLATICAAFPGAKVTTINRRGK